MEKKHSQMRRMYGLLTYIECMDYLPTMNIQKSHGTARIGFQPQEGEGKTGMKQKDVKLER